MLSLFQGIKVNYMLRTISKLSKFYDKIYLIYPGPVIEYLGVLLIDYFFASDQTEKLAVPSLLKCTAYQSRTLHLLSNIVNM